LTVGEGQAPTSTSEADRNLLREIRRRRAIDLAFSLLGMFLVTASLAVLVLLFGQLVRDGHGRLVSGHLVKTDGFAPSIRELVGVLERTPEGGWVFRRDTYLITNARSVLDSATLESLEGKTVLVSGDLPTPGRTRMTTEQIVQTEEALPRRFNPLAMHGRLERRAEGWAVAPTPLPVDLGGVQIDVAALEGKPAALAFEDRRLPLKVRSIERLVFQSFFGSMPSREPERAGIRSALVGSVLVVFVTMVLAVPLGVAAGVWLEEYGRKNWLTALIDINIANLAGVPSIIWGLMALGLLVYYFGFQRSIQTAGITLGLLVLPIVIMATREAIRAIPDHIREASYACGAGKWQTVRYHIIPYSMSGILTGSIIGLSRAIGETAPLITIGALTYIAFLPDFSWSNPLGWLDSGFTVLPIQMFNWISRPDKAFEQNAAAAGMVLLVLTLSMNALAIVLRYRLRKRIKW